MLATGTLRAGCSYVAFLVAKLKLTVPAYGLTSIQRSTTQNKNVSHAWREAGMLRGQQIEARAAVFPPTAVTPEWSERRLRQHQHSQCASRSWTDCSSNIQNMPRHSTRTGFACHSLQGGQSPSYLWPACRRSHRIDPRLATASRRRRRPSNRNCCQVCCHYQADPIRWIRKSRHHRNNTRRYCFQGLPSALVTICFQQCLLAPSKADVRALGIAMRESCIFSPVKCSLCQKNMQIKRPKIGAPNKFLESDS